MGVEGFAEEGLGGGFVGGPVQTGGAQHVVLVQDDCLFLEILFVVVSWGQDVPYLLASSSNVVL